MAVIIDDAFIHALVSRPELCREFPVLLSTTPTPACCGRQAGYALNCQAIKASLAGMPTDRKELFKRMLGLSEVRIIFQSQNAVVDVTF